MEVAQRSCPVTGYNISGIEPSVSAITVLDHLQCEGKCKSLCLTKHPAMKIYWR
jgi:hypothetical protein